MLDKLRSYRKNRGFLALVSLIIGMSINLCRGILRGYWLVFIGRGVKIRSRSRLTIGRMTRIEDWCVIDAFGEHGIEIGSRCKIGRYSNVIVPGDPGKLGQGIYIGNGTTFGEFCHIGGAGSVTIGADNSFGQYVSIHPQNHIFDGDGFKEATTEYGVEIGAHNWIGAKATFLDKSKIGDRCIVGACTLVKEAFGNEKTIVGVPGKIVKSIS